MSLDPSPLEDHGGGFSTWHAYDPSCKAELWSTQFQDNSITVLFDPIVWPKDQPLPIGPLEVVQTNANHERSCDLALAQPRAKTTSQPRGFAPIPLPGAGQGESAYFHPSTGTLVVGDALIHLAPNPLMVLPDKYCTDPLQLRQSLGSLLKLPIRRIFFAHGAPILQDGSEKIRCLLS